MKLTLDAISKRLNGKDLFTDFSLELQSGMRLCICGANGVGKSVLLKIMAGKEDVDKGNVLHGKNIHIGYVEQELTLNTPDITLLHYVQSALPNWELFWNDWNNATQENNTERILQLTQKQLEWEERYGYAPEYYCTEILFGLGFTSQDLNKTLYELSGGYRERAKLARVLVTGADILLLDEPINHLDLDAIEWLEKFLCYFKGIIVFIAHDRVFMDNVATHTLYLGGSKPFLRKGSYSNIIQLLHEIEEQKKLQSQHIEKEIEAKMTFIERFKAKSSKARQANSKQKAVKRLEKELESLQQEKKQRTISFRFPTPHKAEKTLVIAENLSKKFNDRTLWYNLNFTIYNDSVIALVGPNGSGKSTLLKTILGIIKPSTGTIIQSPSLRFGYFSQHQSDILYEQNTVLEEIYRLSDQKSSYEEQMSVLGLFLLVEHCNSHISSLSGGEKNRVILASIFLSKANMLILDEPTNHLDLETRYALITALSNFQGAILLIAHDRHLLQQIAKEYWHISHLGITPYYTYDEYMKAKYSEIKPSLIERESSSPKNSSTLQDKGALQKEDRKKQKQIEAQIRSQYYTRIKPLKENYTEQEEILSTLYHRISEIETTLSLKEMYENISYIEDLTKELSQLYQQIDTTIEKLIDIEEKMKEINNEYHIYKDFP